MPTDSFSFAYPSPTEIYTLSLHDALPISRVPRPVAGEGQLAVRPPRAQHDAGGEQDPGDRKSTRLNSSHEWNSYAVFCLKKKKSARLTNTSSTSRMTKKLRSKFCRSTSAK